ncbi:MAG TPA: glycosyltransferase family 4 protein [Candidatus Limnocylindria bacterium]|nr:glycosyltransferase family 4 protein [Candidatus Limnocylindria bacterium]
MIPRVAIACSGLGHVRRGNEAWAHALAEALHAAGEPVTLFGAGPLPVSCPYRRLWSLPREHVLWRGWMGWLRRYQLEQYVFARSLRRALRDGGHDLVHVADPQLAWWVREAVRALPITVIYKDGLMLGPDWNWRFDRVQVLAPFYREEAMRLGKDAAKWAVIPHFVDATKFAPSAARAALRRKVLGETFSDDALVVLAVGDLAGRSQKRLDWVVRETAAVPGAHLLVAGQATPADVMAFELAARPLLGNRLHLRPNVPPSDMPGLYPVADIFAHAALREPFGLVFLEAMACGVPIVAHRFAVTRWIVGEAGETMDMEAAGVLATVLKRWQVQPVYRSELSRRARLRAETVFAPAGILPLYRHLYADIRKERKP